MDITPIPEPDSVTCTIRVKGHLGTRWEPWFDDMTITPEPNGDTTLTGQLIDQAALHGLLRKVRDLGLPLVSVTCDDGKDPFL